MFDKILVPLDGSELSDRILGVVLRLILRDRSELKLVRVVTPDETDEHGEEEARAIARDQLATVASALGERGVRASFEVLDGDAAEEILACADEWSPSLIALSSHGSSGVARWIRGSVAERLLRASRQPLLIANPIALGPCADWRSGDPARELACEVELRRILVPLDGSERANAVLPLVREVASRYESQVVLLHVARRGAQTPEPRLLEPALEQLAGVERRCEIVEGRAAESILDRAEAGSFDLVALTTHGASGESAWPFGSTAEHVLRHCPAPILVQRTGAFAQTADGRAGAASSAR